MMGLARNLFVVGVLVGVVAWSFAVGMEPDPAALCRPTCCIHTPDVLYGPGRGPGPLSVGLEFGPELIVNYPPATM